MVTIKNEALLAELVAEQGRLMDVLKNVPEFKALQKINDLVVAYGGRPTRFEGPLAETPAAQPSEKPQRVEGTGERSFAYGEKTKAVSDAAVAFLTERGRRATSSDFLPYMQAAGIPIGGKNPASTMSSFLAGMPRFNNVKGEGYGLTEWGDGPGPRGHAFRHGGGIADALQMEADFTGGIADATTRQKE